MGRGFKRPGGLSPIRTSVSQSVELGAASPLLGGEGDGGPQNAQNQQEPRGFVAKRRAKSQMAGERRPSSPPTPMSGPASPTSQPVGAKGNARNSIVWSPNRGHVVVKSVRQLTPIHGSTVRSSPKKVPRFLGEDSTPTRGGSDHPGLIPQISDLGVGLEEDARSETRARLLPLDRAPMPETPKSENHYAVPDMALPLSDFYDSDEGGERPDDPRSFLTRQVEGEVMRLLEAMNEQTLRALLEEQRQARAMEAASADHSERRQPTPRTLEEAKAQLIERNLALGLVQGDYSLQKRKKQAPKVRNTSERLLKTRYEAKAPIKHRSVKERDKELDKKLDVYRRDAARREKLKLALADLKRLEIESRGGTDHVRNNMSRADGGDYRYWNEMDRILLRTAQQAVRLREHRTSRREQWIQARGDLNEALRLKEEKRLAMKAAKERQQLLDRLRGRQCVLFPACAAAARVSLWGRAIQRGRVQREVNRQRDAAVKVIQRNLSAMMWRRQFNRRCTLKAFMRKHSWRFLQQVSINRKRRACHVIRTCVQEVSARNKTTESMRIYRYKVLTCQRRARVMSRIWRAQLQVACVYWDSIVQRRSGAQVASAKEPTGKGKKGAGAKGGRDKTSSKARPGASGAGAKGKGGKKGGQAAKAGGVDQINYLLVPPSKSDFVRDRLLEYIRGNRREFAQELSEWRRAHRLWVETKVPLFEAEANALKLLKTESAGLEPPPPQDGQGLGEDQALLKVSVLAQPSERSIATGGATTKRSLYDVDGLSFSWAAFSDQSEAERDADPLYRRHGPPRPVLKFLPRDEELVPMFQAARANAAES